MTQDSRVTSHESRRRRKLAATARRKALGADRVPRYVYAPSGQLFRAQVHEIADVAHLTVTGAAPPGRMFGLKGRLNLLTGEWTWYEGLDYWRTPEMWEVLSVGRDIGRWIVEEEQLNVGLHPIGQARLFPVEDRATVNWTTKESRDR